MTLATLHRPYILKRIITLLVMSLLLIGILFVFEASATESLDIYANKYTMTIQQGKWLVLAVLLSVIASYIPSKIYEQAAPFVYWTGIILLVAIFIPGLGVEVNGAHRWVELFGMRFQPVEIVKLGIVLYFARWLSTHQKPGPFIFLTALPAVLIMLQPDLGSTLITLAIAGGLYVAAGAKIKNLLILAALGIITVSILIFSSDYRYQRLQTFLNPQTDTLDSGYHIHQITIALGNGGFSGTGLGQSKQKYRYIPELSTDSIFAIIAEETGFVGSVFVIGLFFFFSTTLFAIARQQEAKSFAFYATTGVAIWLSSQILLNLSAVVALVPLTGIPLPFISRGGTSLVTIMVGLGMVFALTKNQQNTLHTKLRLRK